MALAIDASTPPWVDSGASPAVTNLSTASFTPPLGALLVLVYGNDWNIDPLHTPTNTGGAVSWAGSAAVSEAANGGCAAIWLGTVTSSAAMTVNENIVNSDGGWGFGIVVVTGQAAVQNGATQIATSASGTPSATIASLQGSNSLVIGAVANVTNTTAPTIPGGQSDVFGSRTYFGSGQGSRWAQYLTGMNLSAGSSATINDTAPAAIAYCLAMVEILAPAVPAPPRAYAFSYLPRNTLGRGVRNQGQIAAFLERVPKATPAVTTTPLWVPTYISPNGTFY